MGHPEKATGLCCRGRDDRRLGGLAARIFFDLHYADLMREPVAVMRSLYGWAGDDLTASTEQAMLGWLDEHPQDRFGVAPYSLEGSGVTRGDLEPIFDEYLSVFDVELEGVAAE